MAELLSEVNVRATQRSTKNHGPPKADEETQEIEKMKTKMIGSAITAMRRRRKRDRDCRTGLADGRG